jgi:potassium-dependent mechanosensitive channel
MPRSALRLAALLLTLATTARAQDLVTAPRDTVATDSTAPAAVPLADIPAMAQVSESRLLEIGQILADNRAMTQVAHEYAATRDTIAQLIELQSRPSPEPPTKRSLSDLHNEWARRAQQVGNWRKATGERAATLSAIQVELKRQKAIWSLTMDTVRKADAPAEVQGLVERILRGTRDVDAALAAQLATILDQQSQMVETISTMQRADNLISDQLELARRSIFHIDYPPLWKGLGLATDTTGFGDAVRAGIERTGKVFTYFVQEYRVPIYFHLASTLALLLAVFWFRGQLEPHTSEMPAASARRVLDHPLAGAVLIIALATLFLYPRAPASVYDLALLVTVPVMLRLLPSFLPPDLVRPALIGSLLFAGQRAAALLVGDSPYRRPGILLVSLAAAAGLLWLLRKGGAFERLGEHAYARVVRGTARVATVFFLGSAVSNIVGNLTLAMFLTRGTLDSGYLALVMLTAVRLADGVLIVFTRSKSAGVSRFVHQQKDALAKAGIRLTHFLAVAGWIGATLWLFDALDPVVQAVQRMLGATFTLGELHLSLGAALLFLATIWVSVVASRGLSSVLEVDVLSRLDMPRGLPSVVARLTRYAMIAIGFLLALATTGVELTQLSIIGGGLGVGIGFGLQNVVSNFVSGLILAFERPIREGDVIQLTTLTGEVRRIGARATIIRTFDGAEVIVPNASLIANDVVNWTLSDQHRRLTVKVGVAYGTDAAKVQALLLAVPAGNPGVLRTPEPLALFTGFGESALNFELRFWTADADRVSLVLSEITSAVNNALVAAGIEIPFPQRDLHLRSVDAPAAARLREVPAPPKESA